MLRRSITLLAFLLAFAACTHLCAAQIPGSVIGHGAARLGPGIRPARGFGRGSLFFGSGPLFYPDYYPPSAPFEMVPQPSVPSSHIEDLPPKAAPLLIEWQGDHYQRFGGSAAPERAAAAAPDYVEVHPAASVHSQNPQPAPQLVPALVVFRDGHREEVPDYAIVDGTMYVRGEYWRTGYWTKNIQLSSLDLPATIQANHQRGVNFILPSGPNEVVTRP